MRLATIFGRTLRQAPTEADNPATQLLWRAGMLRSLDTGEPALLPLGNAVLQHLITHLTNTLRRNGSQEIYLPTMASWLDVITTLARREIDSYRQLPLSVWSLRRRRRATVRQRSGLLDLPIVTSLSWAGLALDVAQVQTNLAAIIKQLRTTLHECGLTVVADALKTERGATIIVDTKAGPLTTLDCPVCGGRAPIDLAPLAPLPPYSGLAPAMSLVETPNANTIAALAAFLGITTSATAKALFFSARCAGEQRLIFAVVRGDREASLSKLAAVVGADELLPADEAQIRACGAVPGYASPVGLHNVFVVADQTVTNGAPLVAGANRPGYHLRDVVYGRDWQATLVADIAQAMVGDPCPFCGTARVEGIGAAVGVVTPLQATTILVQDADGHNRPLVIAGIELDLEPLLHIAVERNHDERGIVWPVAIAPVAVHLVTIGRSDALITAAQTLATELQTAGWRVLIDDRDERAGVKFNDADLIGAPWRVVISEKLLATNQVEVRYRTAGQPTIVNRSELKDVLAGAVANGS
jgi:Prolyl-tRNA synthetase